MMQLLNQIEETHVKMKNSYFWSPPSNAARRRNYESYNSNSAVFYVGDTLWEIHQSTDCSCKNIYYRLTIHVNEEKKDIRALRRLIAKGE